MIRTKLAKKVLNKSEQKHLTEQKIHSMQNMIDQVKHMQNLCPENPRYVCLDCWTIAIKLKIV